MHASEVTPEAAERANNLYWTSGRSVNQIAEELDLSKGALYGILEPEKSGLGCPLCGDEVGYPNRTAKERGSLECPTCAWDGSADETTSYIDPGSDGDVADSRPALPADPHADVLQLRPRDSPRDAPLRIRATVPGNPELRRDAGGRQDPRSGLRLRQGRSLQLCGKDLLRGTNIFTIRWAFTFYARGGFETR